MIVAIVDKLAVGVWSNSQQVSGLQQQLGACMGAGADRVCLLELEGRFNLKLRVFAHLSDVAFHYIRTQAAEDRRNVFDLLLLLFLRGGMNHESCQRQQ